MPVATGLDEFLLPLDEYVTSFGLSLDGVDSGMQIDSLLLEMPVELVVESHPAGWRLLTAPPTQHLTTSLMPVFHQIRLRLAPT
jgi:hypothetical protein